MARLHLVRHGQASAGWSEDVDPGLSAAGRGQAALAADTLAGFGPLPIWTSPLRRTQETAEPLASRWAATPVIEDAVRELPAPTADLAGRAEWLRTALSARWPTMGEVQCRWRRSVLDRLCEASEDMVVFTHFVVINVVVGAATGSDHVVACSPANGSVTTVDVSGGRFQVVRLGAQAETVVR